MRTLLKEISRLPYWHILFIALFAIFNGRGLLQVGYPGGTDSLILPTLANYERVAGISTWFSWLDYGQPSFFFHSPLILIMSLIGNTIIAYKFIAILSFFFSGTTTYFVSLKLTGFRLAALASALIYMNSQFMFSQFFEGHLDIMFGYSLFPLAIYLAYTLFTVSYTRALLYSSFEVLFLLSSHLNITFIGALSILGTLIISVFHHRSLGFRALLGKAILLMTAGACLSAFFVLPFFGGARSLYITYPSIITDPNEAISSGIIGSITGVSIENSFIYFWKNTSYSFPIGLLLSGFSIGGALLFLASCISVKWHRFRFSSWLFAALIISILIASGMTFISAPAFAFLWKYFPFFNTVRMLDRWLMIASLSESLLIAILISSLRTKPLLQNRNHFRHIKIEPFRTTLAIVAIIIIASPTVFIFYPPSWTPPSEYDQAIRWLASHSDNDNTMVVPFGGVYMRSADYGVTRNPGYVGLLLANQPVYAGEGATTEMRQLSNFLGNAIISYQNGRIPQILGWLGTKYFLFSPPSNDSLFSGGWNHVSAIWNPNISYKNLLDQYELKNETSFGNLMILSNSNSQDMFTISNSPILLLGGQNSLLIAAQIAGNSTSTPAFISITQQPQQISSNLLNFSSLMLADSEYNDLLMFNVDSEYLVGADQLHELTVGNATLDNSGMAKGILVLSDSLVRLTPGSSIMLNGASSIAENTSFWVRVAFDSEASTLKVINGNSSRQLSTKAPVFQDFRWIEVFSSVTQDEPIIIEQQASGETYCQIDAVALVPNNALYQAESKTNELLNSVNHKLYFVSAANPSIVSDFHLESKKKNATNQYVLTSSGPSKLSVPFIASEGNNYIYVRHGTNPTEDSTFSVSVDNETDTSWSLLSKAPTTVALSANGWGSDKITDVVTITNTDDYEKVISWKLSDQTALTKGYLYYHTLLNLESSNYVAVRVFGDGSGNKLGAYFYDLTNHWVHYQLASEGMNWKGWGEIALDLNSFDSTSGDFDWSNVAGITIEYNRNPNSPPSREIMFTPYGFYHVQESQSDFVWSKLGPFETTSNKANLELSAKGPLTIDSIITTDVGDMQSLSDLICSSSSISKNASRLSQTEFEMQIETSNHSILIFKQAYHPLWQASLDNYQLQQINVDFALNGFIINDDSAKATLRIWYEGDKLLAKGLWISAISLLLLAILASTITIRNLKKRYAPNHK
jgi:hypothetical protein